MCESQTDVGRYPCESHAVNEFNVTTQCQETTQQWLTFHQGFGFSASFSASSICADAGRKRVVSQQLGVSHSEPLWQTKRPPHYFFGPMLRSCLDRGSQETAGSYNPNGTTYCSTHRNNAKEWSGISKTKPGNKTKQQTKHKPNTSKQSPKTTSTPTR